MILAEDMDRVSVTRLSVDIAQSYFQVQVFLQESPKSPVCCWSPSSSPPPPPPASWRMERRSWHFPHGELCLLARRKALQGPCKAPARPLQGPATHELCFVPEALVRNHNGTEHKAYAVTFNGVIFSTTDFTPRELLLRGASLPP